MGERREREEERRAEAEVLGAREELGGAGTVTVPSHPPLHGIGRRGLGDGGAFLFVSFFFRNAFPL